MTTISFEEVRKRAVGLGLDDLGIAASGESRTFPLFDRWIEAGEAGDMTYLARQKEARRHPDSILPGVKTLLVGAVTLDRLSETPSDSFSVPPNLSSNPLPRGKKSDRADGGSANVSEDVSDAAPRGELIPYSVRADYHGDLRRKLHLLAGDLAKTWPKEKFRVVVDTAPILEKEWAVRAGLGVIVKNSLLIHPRFGSELFLGILLTTVTPQSFIMSEPFVTPEPFTTSESFAEKKPNDDSDRADPCRDCSLCSAVCPTGALASDRTLHAKKCLNYWLIEYQGERLPNEIREKSGNRLFGCDTCRRVCPKNRPLPPPVTLSLKRVAAMTEEEFRSLFAGTPVERLGLARFRRNAARSGE